jgi:hypothetical protein
MGITLPQNLAVKILGVTWEAIPRTLLQETDKRFVEAAGRFELIEVLECPLTLATLYSVLRLTHFFVKPVILKLSFRAGWNSPPAVGALQK